VHRQKDLRSNWHQHHTPDEVRGKCGENGAGERREGWGRESVGDVDNAISESRSRGPIHSFSHFSALFCTSLSAQAELDGVADKVPLLEGGITHFIRRVTIHPTAPPRPLAVHTTPPPLPPPIHSTAEVGATATTTAAAAALAAAASRIPPVAVSAAGVPPLPPPVFNQANPSAAGAMGVGCCRAATTGSCGSCSFSTPRHPPSLTLAQSALSPLPIRLPCSPTW
jgi:hypothetical protein